VNQLPWGCDVILGHKLNPKGERIRLWTLKKSSVLTTALKYLMIDWYVHTGPSAPAVLVRDIKRNRKLVGGPVSMDRGQETFFFLLYFLVVNLLF
jgi:hypothetical protein